MKKHWHILLCIFGVFLFYYSFAHRSMPTGTLKQAFESGNMDEWMRLQRQASIEAWIILIIGIVCVSYCSWKIIASYEKKKRLIAICLFLFFIWAFLMSFIYFPPYMLCQNYRLYNRLKATEKIEIIIKAGDKDIAYRIDDKNDIKTISDAIPLKITFGNSFFRESRDIRKMNEIGSFVFYEGSYGGYGVPIYDDGSAYILMSKDKASGIMKIPQLKEVYLELKEKYKTKLEALEKPSDKQSTP